MNDKNDLISRNAARSVVENQCVDGKMYGNEETEGTLVDAYAIIDGILDLPAVTPPERTGHWEKRFYSCFGRHQCVCSECKNDEYWKKNFCYGYESYCPNCGAHMKKEAQADGLQ